MTEMGELLPVAPVARLVTGRVVSALAPGAYCALRWLDAAGTAPEPGPVNVPMLVEAETLPVTVWLCDGRLLMVSV